MAPTTLFFIFLAVCRLGTRSAGELCRGTQCFSGQEWSRRCVGAHCQRRADPAVALRLPQAQAQPHRVSPSYQRDAHSYGHHQPQSAPLAPYIIHAQSSATDGTGGGGRRTNPRTITAEVFHPDCAGGTCPTTVSHRQSSDDCRGIGCKLPPRTPPKPGSCVGDGCAGLVGDAARGRSSGPVHVTERAAQSLDEFPDFGSERGAFIQLACDMKPGQYRREAIFFNPNSTLITIFFFLKKLCLRDQRGSVGRCACAAAAAFQEPGDAGGGPPKPAGRSQGATEAPRRAARDAGQPATRNPGPTEEDVRTDGASKSTEVTFSRPRTLSPQKINLVKHHLRTMGPCPPLGGAPPTLGTSALFYD